MVVKQTIPITQMIPQYWETDGLGRRCLLTPDEILRFPNEELLIILRGENVLRANKFDFTEHPYAKKIIPASIFDYAPHREPAIKPVAEKNLTPQTEPKEAPPPQTGNKPPAEPKLFAAIKPQDEF